MENAEFFRIVFTTTAKEMLRTIGRRYGKKAYQVLRDKIRELEFDPDKRGAPLTRELKGLYSLHYGRYRVIYKIERSEAIVLVIAAGYHYSGVRNDIYEVVQRLVESGAIVINEPK